MHAEFSCQPDYPQHAYTVFPISAHGIADDAQTPCPQVFIAIQIIPDFFVNGIKKQCIDGKIPSTSIFFLATEHIVAQEAPMLIGMRGRATVIAVVSPSPES